MSGEKQGGLIGELFGNWLCIEYLWVNEKLRRQGFGSKLLEMAEKKAVSHGAKYVFVDTFDFQAPGFYEKHGYEQVFKLFDCPYTGERYFISNIYNFPSIRQYTAKLRQHRTIAEASALAKKCAGKPMVSCLMGDSTALASAIVRCCHR